MFCRKCGGKLEDGWIVCPRCGDPQKQGDTQQIFPGISNKWRTAARVAVILLVLIMLGNQMPDNTEGSRHGAAASKKAVREEKAEKGADTKSEGQSKTAENQQNTQENSFSIPAGTYVNNHSFPGWQALVAVDYVSEDWLEVSLFTESYTNTAVFYGGKVDGRTIQVTAEGTGVTLTLHWENEREMTITRTGEFAGTDSSMFNDMTSTNYTLASRF